MFPRDRQAQMRGDHQRLDEGIPNREYALLVDVAGEDEEIDGSSVGRPSLTEGAHIGAPAQGGLGRRDFTAVTVVEVDRSTCGDPLIGAPTYRVVSRYWWRGVRHVQLYAKIVDLANNVWKAHWVVCDATGVGAGMASFLVAAMPGRVMPFVFSSKSKSDLGWGYLAVCDTGRFKDHADDGSTEYAQFWREVEHADYEILDGPGKRMRWGVWDPLVHDDLLISASLCALLDDAAGAYVESTIVEAADVL